MIRALLAFLIIPACFANAAGTTDIYGKIAQRVSDPELRKMTASVLRREGKNYKDIAEKNLTEKGEIFDHARVEVTGFMSNDRTDPELVDPSCQIKPSFSVKDGGLVSVVTAPVSDALNKLFPVIGTGKTVHDADLDYDEVKKAMKGEVTERAQLKIQDYGDKEIEEILAHSWGTELVYAAILNGKLRPPKRLIVVGVPDDDFAKWEMLAARTGTEVHWARAANDKIALGGVKLAKDVAGKIDFKAKWDALCNDPDGKLSCPAHHRAPASVIREKVSNIPGIDGHARVEYYALLKGRVFKSKFKDLVAAEEAAKNAEIRKVANAALENALIEARGLVAQAHEQQIETAHRDHDERLRTTYAAVAKRSCAIPGSVTQAELNRLPEPYTKDMIGTMPDGLTPCETQVYLSLGKGVDAGEIQKKSTPLTAIAAQPAPPGPVIANSNAVNVSSFLLTLPKVRDFAVASCRSSGQAPLTEDITRSNSNIQFGSADDQEADRLSAGLGLCEERLFRRLIGVIRTGNPENITSAWIQEQVRQYSPAPLAPQRPTRTPPTDTRPAYTPPPPAQGRRCEDYGNQRCPH